MKYLSNGILVFLFATLLISCDARPSPKATSLMNKIIVTDAWVRTANQGANSAAYLTIINNTGQTDTLQTITSDIAEMVGIHKTFHNEDGMTGMKEAGVIIIKPDSGFVLKPGGYHIMLMNLNKTLAQGDSVQFTLHFATTGDMTVITPVKGQ